MTKICIKINICRIRGWKQIMLWGPKMGSFWWFDWNVHKWNKSFKSSWMTFQTAGSSSNWIIFILEMLTLKHRTAGIRREEDWCWYWWSAIHFNNDNWSNHDMTIAPERTVVDWKIEYSAKMSWCSCGFGVWDFWRVRPVSDWTGSKFGHFGGVWMGLKFSFGRDNPRFEWVLSLTC